MKITILMGPFMCLPPDSVGAVEKLWNSVANKWISQGVDVTIICKRSGKSINDNNRIYIRGYERTGNWLKDFGLDFIYSVRALKAAPESDVLILNSQWSPLLIRAKKSRYKNVIYSVERYPKKQLRLYKKIGKVDHFRCCSNAVMQAAIAQFPEIENSTFVIPNFIDTEVFSSELPHELSNLPIVVYSGRINREKGLDLLVGAVDYLNVKFHWNIRIMLIGPIDLARGGSGEEYAQSLNEKYTSGHIIWKDAIYDPKELAATIRLGDIFCYPSIAEKGETFGVAPLEAMALGVPVVVSSLQCFRDFLEDGVNGAVFNYESNDPVGELADKIKELLGDLDLYRKYSANGINTAKQFSIDKVANSYLKKFSEIM